MNTDPVAALREATQTFTHNWKAGMRPRAAFEADREATRTLGDLLSAARHFAGILPPASARDARFDGLHRQWHWRTLG